MKLKNFFYIFNHQLMVLIFFFSTAKAQNEITAAAAKLTTLNNQSFLVFTDGKKAKLILQIKKNLTLKLNYQITENICFPEFVTDSCFWEVEAFAYDAIWIWAEHPNPEKIDQPLRIKEGFSQNKNLQFIEMKYSLNNYFTSFLLDESNPLFFHLPTLTCKDDRWLKELPAGYEDSSFLVPSWAIETMQENLFLRRNENQTLVQINESTLKFLSSGHYELRTNKETTSLFKNIFFLFDMQTLYYIKDERSCSIQAKSINTLNNLENLLNQQPVKMTLPGLIKTKNLNNEFFSLFFNHLKRLSMPNFKHYTVEIE
ncbi:MAG: hypothetical protein L6Q37_05035 [Bdellovibrionaceae bacterium]|nr:hypothetical protein [Pseudobdellovibrionaceae bacterium]NUM58023.1 hypothetical protein [Pseudobdellovibrionaceae bacterium]